MVILFVCLAHVDQYTVYWVSVSCSVWRLTLHAATVLPRNVNHFEDKKIIIANEKTRSAINSHSNWHLQFILNNRLSHKEISERGKCIKHEQNHFLPLVSVRLLMSLYRVAIPLLLPSSPPSPPPSPSPSSLTLFAHRKNGFYAKNTDFFLLCN